MTRCPNCLAKMHYSALARHLRVHHGVRVRTECPRSRRPCRGASGQVGSSQGCGTPSVMSSLKGE